MIGVHAIDHGRQIAAKFAVGCGSHELNVRDTYLQQWCFPMAKLFAATLFHIFAAGSGAAQAEGAAQTAVGVPLRESVPHIVTTGSATIQVVPDLADIRLGVTTERLTADEATKITAESAIEVIAAIKAHGLGANDIKTGFSVSAQYDYAVDPVTHVNKQTFRNYKATETLVVRLHDVSKAGSLARELIEKGANSFQSIDFSYSKEKTARRQLDAEAMRDAFAAAKTYTDAVNLTLGRVLQIGGEIQDSGGVADLPIRGTPQNVHVAIPTEPGVQTLKESVSVIWEIEGKAH